jgi:transcriptional regulator with XRE-family HTH domain
MSEIKRLRKVLNWLYFNEYAENDTDFSQKIGYTKSSFSQITNGKVPLSDKFLNKLCAFNQNINKVWILTGEWSMLKEEKAVVAEEKSDNVELMALELKYLKEINELRKEIEKLRSEIVKLRGNDVVTVGKSELIKFEHE